MFAQQGALHIVGVPQLVLAAASVMPLNFAVQRLADSKRTGAPSERIAVSVTVPASCPNWEYSPWDPSHPEHVVKAATKQQYRSKISHGPLR